MSHSDLQTARELAQARVERELSAKMAAQECPLCRLRLPCRTHEVRPCAYTRTGWAFADGDACTCREAPAPTPAAEPNGSTAMTYFREWLLKAAAAGDMQPLDVLGVSCPERRCAAAARTPCFTGEHPDPTRDPHQARVRAAIEAGSFRPTRPTGNGGSGP